MLKKGSEHLRKSRERTLREKQENNAEGIQQKIVREKQL